jgi:hypothetical protein
MAKRKFNSSDHDEEYEDYIGREETRIDQGGSQCRSGKILM